jgi:hypothetical protein
MAPEPDEIQRIAAKSLAADTGMTIEQALEALAFQDAAMEVVDDVERALGEASGDLWFDWCATGGRLKVAVTMRAEASQIDAARAILESVGRADRSDFVSVIWSTSELEHAQARADRVLDRLGPLPWSTGRDPAANSIAIDVPDELTIEQLKVLEAAISAAAVSVHAHVGPGWGRLAG